MISLNIEKTFGFISKEKVFAYEAEVKAAQEMLEKGTGKGNDFLGWLHLPSSITKEHLADLNATAKVLRDNCEVVIVAGLLLIILRFPSRSPARCSSRCCCRRQAWAARAKACAGAGRGWALAQRQP